MVSYSFPNIISESPEAPWSQTDLMNHIYSLYKAKIFSEAAKLKGCNSPAEVGVWAQPCMKGVNIVFSNSFAILRLGLHWTRYKLYQQLWIKQVIKQVHLNFSCLGKFCTAVLLWSFINVLWTTKSNLSSAWGRLDDDWYSTSSCFT